MGQKVDPRAMRLGEKGNRKHDARWFADKKHFKVFLHEDIVLREHIEKKYRNADIAKVVINRPSLEEISIEIYTYKVGALMGRKASEIDVLKKALSKLVDKKINIHVKEMPSNTLNARVLGIHIANSIEKRTPFKKAMNQALNRAKKMNVVGIKLSIAGRLNGAEIARTETALHGKVPLHSLDYDIDYAHVEANTVTGVIGIKVWICNGVKKGGNHVNA